MALSLPQFCIAINSFLIAGLTIPSQSISTLPNNTQQPLVRISTMDVETFLTNVEKGDVWFTTTVFGGISQLLNMWVNRPSTPHILSNSISNVAVTKFYFDLQATPTPAVVPLIGTIAFVDSTGGISEINVDGTNLHQVRATGNHPTWSNDGRQIAFFDKDASGQAQLFKMDGSGQKVTQITTTGVCLTSIAWSPDDSKIAYSSPAVTSGLATLASPTSCDLYTRSSTGKDKPILNTTGVKSFVWSVYNQNLLVTKTSSASSDELDSLDVSSAQTEPLSVTATAQVVGSDLSLSSANNNCSSTKTISDLKRSPDGKQFSYQATCAGVIQYVVADANTKHGTVVYQQPTSTSTTSCLLWLPNGNGFIYGSNTKVSYALSANNVALSSVELPALKNSGACSSAASMSTLSIIPSALGDKIQDPSLDANGALQAQAMLNLYTDPLTGRTVYTSQDILDNNQNLLKSTLYGGHLDPNNGYATTGQVAMGFSQGGPGQLPYSGYFDPVSGNYIYTQDDISLPGLGQNLNLRHTYTYYRAGYGERVMGPGWTNNFNIRLIMRGTPFNDGAEDPVGKITLQESNGSRQTFTALDSTHYVADPGLYADLIQGADASNHVVYTVILRDSTRYQFNSIGELISIDNISNKAGGFNALTLTQGDGVTALPANYSCQNKTLGTLNMRLLRVTDTNNDYLEFCYDSESRLVEVHDSRGGSLVSGAPYVQYNYASASIGDPITSVRDWRGKVWVYQYDIYGRPILQIIFAPTTGNNIQWVEPKNCTSTAPVTCQMQQFYVGNGTEYLSPIRNVNYTPNSNNTIFTASIDTEPLSVPGIDDSVGLINATQNTNNGNLTTTLNSSYGLSTWYDTNDQPIAINLTEATTFFYSAANTAPNVANSKPWYIGYVSYPAVASGQPGRTDILTYTNYSYTVYGQTVTFPLLSKVDQYYGGSILNGGVSGGTLRYEYRYQYGDATYPTLPTEIDHADMVVSPTNPERYQYQYYTSGLLAVFTDPMGIKTLFTYYPNGQIQNKVLNCKPCTVTAGSDPVSLPVPTYTAPDANVTTNYTYDANGRVTDVADMVTGRDDHTIYDDVNNIVTTVQNYKSVTFNAGNPYQSPLLPDQNLTTRVQYNDIGKLISTTNPLNHQTTYSYYTNGGLKEIDEPDGSKLNFTFGAATALTVGIQNTNPAGIATTDAFCFDPLYRLVDHVANSTGPLVPCIATTNAQAWTKYQYTYGGAGEAVGRRPTSVFDYLNGVTTSYRYDDLSNLTTTTKNDTLYGFVPTWTAHYDPFGNLVSQVDPIGQTTLAGHVTYQCYDLDHRPVYQVKNATSAPACTASNPGAIMPPGLVTSPTAASTDFVSAWIYDLDGRQTDSYDPLGRHSTASYDGVGRVIQTVQNSTGTAFNPSQVDRNITQTVSYDLVNYLQTVTDSLGHVSQTTFDALWRPVKVKQNVSTATGPDLNITSLTLYDAAGEITAQTDPATNPSPSFTTNGSGSNIAIPGAATSYTYDSMGHRLTTTDPSNATTTSTYDSLGNVLSVQGPDTPLTQYTYDGLQRLVQTIVGASSGAPLVTQVCYANYTSSRQVTTAQTNAASSNYCPAPSATVHLTAVDYNMYNEPLIQIRNYQPSLAVNQISAPSVNVWTWIGYDLMGNPGVIEMPNDYAAAVASGDLADYSQTLIYDAANRLISTTQVTTGEIRATKNGYIGPSSGEFTWTTAYDAAGRTITQTTPQGNKTATTYDLLDDPTSLARTGTNSDTIAMAYSYTGTVGGATPLDRQTSMTDSSSANPTVYHYDGLDRLTSITGGINNLGGGVAPNANPLSYQYDQGGRRTQIGFPDGRTVSYQYYNNDALQSVLLGGPWSAAGSSSSTYYTYVPGSHLPSQISYSNNVTETLGYDGDLRLNALDYANSANKLFHIDYQYDTFSNRNVATEYLPESGSSGSQPSPTPTSASYNGLLQRKIAYNYDGLNRLTSAIYTDNGTASLYYAYNYDLNSNRLTAAVQYLGNPPPAPTGTPTTAPTITPTNPGAPTFMPTGCIDGFGCPTALPPSQTPSATPTPSLTPSPTASLTPTPSLTSLASLTPTPSLTPTSTSTGGRGAIGTWTGTNYAYNTANQLKIAIDLKGTITPFVYSTLGTTTFTYNPDGTLGTQVYAPANGSPTTPYNIAYSYDSADRLIGVVNSQTNQTTNYAYDGQNHRVGMTVVAAGQTVNTHYLVDPTGLLPQALAEYPSVGTPTYYIPAGTLIGQDQGGAIGLSYFATDELGSVRATFDKTGSKTGSVNYDPYGSILPDPGASGVASHIGYTGALTDANGLVYLNARYYNPGSGQFLSADPMAGQPADPGSFNLYGYVQGNPINATDVTGKRISWAPDQEEGPGGGSGGGSNEFGCEGYDIGAASGCPRENDYFIETAQDNGGRPPRGGDPEAQGITASDLNPNGNQTTNNSDASNSNPSTNIIPASGSSTEPDYTNDPTLYRLEQQTANIPEGEKYNVAPYGDQPAPRPEGTDGEPMQAHHGVMSRFMQAMFGDAYNADEAPSILIDASEHRLANAVYSVWRAAFGRAFDWATVTWSDAISLATNQMNAAGIPAEVQEEFWRQFDNYLSKLKGS